MRTLTNIVVGMADIQVVQGSGVLSCLGLGSCIGLCALDPVAGVAGMAHIMLPESLADKAVDKPGKFANTAVPALLQLMEENGATRDRLVFAMAGGAQVFPFGSGIEPRMDIGGRNDAAVLATLSQLNFQVKNSDTGGSLGRTLIFNVETGVIKVRTVSKSEKELCVLR